MCVCVFIEKFNLAEFATFFLILQKICELNVDKKCSYLNCDKIPQKIIFNVVVSQQPFIPLRIMLKCMYSIIMRPWFHLFSKIFCVCHTVIQCRSILLESGDCFTFSRRCSTEIMMLKLGNVYFTMFILYCTVYEIWIHNRHIHKHNTHSQVSCMR